MIPVVLLLCTGFCRDLGDSYICYCDLKAVCEPYERVCVESATVVCKPLSVPLGPWDPIPAPKDW